MRDLQGLITRCTKEIKRHMTNKIGMSPFAEEIKIELISEIDGVYIRVSCEHEIVKDRILYKVYPSRAEYSSSEIEVIL